MNGFPGECFRCPRPGKPVSAMCVHEHRVDNMICDKHRDKLAAGQVNCWDCAFTVPEASRHVCPLQTVSTTS